MENNNVGRTDMAQYPVTRTKKDRLHSGIATRWIASRSQRKACNVPKVKGNRQLAKQ